MNPVNTPEYDRQMEIIDDLTDEMFADPQVDAAIRAGFEHDLQQRSKLLADYPSDTE